MSLVVNTNIGSLNAQRSLSSSGNELKTAMERLSSGKKINSAADDAAGFAIAERMTAQIRGLNMATKNANDGLSMLAVIENATNDVTDMLQRMRELAVQATNDTNGETDRDFLQAEAFALRHEIERVATQTTYNGQTVLDGSFYGKSIQVGTEAGQKIEFSVSSLHPWELGETPVIAGVSTSTSYNAGTSELTISTSDASSFQVGTRVGFGGDHGPNWSTVSVIEVNADSIVVNIDSEHAGNIDNVITSGGTNIYDMKEKIAMVDLSTPAGAQQALATVTAAIEQLSGQRAGYGALQNRLEYTVSNLMNVSEFTTAARSRIEDADFAAESARLAKAQVLQQTGTAMLAQANSSSQLVLSLIR
ncbi:flagellin [Pseudomonadales bacterium]|nr:flagellin [Pseudomonadales bacterium]